MANAFWIDKTFMTEYAAQIGPSGTLVYVYLCSLIDDRRVCMPSLREISQATGISRNVVLKSLLLLEQRALISVNRHTSGKRQERHCYRVADLSHGSFSEPRILSHGSENEPSSQIRGSVFEPSISFHGSENEPSTLSHGSFSEPSASGDIAAPSLYKPSTVDSNATVVEDISSSTSSSLIPPLTPPTPLRPPLGELGGSAEGTYKNGHAKKKPAPRFLRPSLEEVLTYCQDRGTPEAAEAFFAYYESNGWRVGKNPMQNWHAAASGWIARGRSRGDYLSPDPDGLTTQQRLIRMAVDQIMADKETRKTT